MYTGLRRLEYFYETMYSGCDVCAHQESLYIQVHTSVKNGKGYFSKNLCHNQSSWIDFSVKYSLHLDVWSNVSEVSCSRKRNYQNCLIFPFYTAGSTGAMGVKFLLIAIQKQLQTAPSGNPTRITGKSKTVIYQGFSFGGFALKIEFIQCKCVN